MSEGQDQKNSKRANTRIANAALRGLIDLIDMRIERASRRKNVDQEEEEVQEKPPKKKESKKRAAPEASTDKSKEPKKKEPKEKPDDWVCAGNVLDGTPCPLTSDKQLVAEGTKDKNGVTHATCTVCKKAVKKYRDEERKKKKSEEKPE